MGDFDFNNLEDIKAEEKRLHDEYKAKLALQMVMKSLQKFQKEPMDFGLLVPVEYILY